MTFWKRPVAPQCMYTTFSHTLSLLILVTVTLQNLNGSYMPSFYTLECSKRHHVIRGCMFKYTERPDVTVYETILESIIIVIICISRCTSTEYYMSLLLESTAKKSAGAAQSLTSTLTVVRASYFQWILEKCSKNLLKSLSGF